MNQVGMVPAVIRGKGEYTQHNPGYVVGGFGLEKCSVTAIVEDDKQPYGKTRSKKHQGEYQPVRNSGKVDHACPECDVRDQGIQQLPDRARH